MNPIKWLAFDIGGANLKLADGEGYADSKYFPLWETPHLLPDSLRAMIAEAPAADHIAATMTGELADCYRTKTEGVQKILAAFTEAADQRHTRVYLIDGRLVSPQVALRDPLSAAATNWHALARFAGQYAPQGPALLIDIGSTTADIIPLENGQPAAQGKTDTQRLISGELVYTGIDRSPVCAIAHSLPWRDQNVPVAQELFATARDAYLLLGRFDDAPEDNETADRRGATRALAAERMARQICADRDTFDQPDAVVAAEAVELSQLSLLYSAAVKVISRMTGTPETVVLSGRGEFVSRRLLDNLEIEPRVVSLAQELGPEVSQCATAHALAQLAREA